MKKTDLSPFLNKTLLVVGSGPQKKRFIFQRLKKLGVRVILLNKEKNWADAYVEDWIIANTAKHTEALNAVEAFLATHSEVKIDGVITFWEYEVLLTSKLVKKLEVIGIPFEIANHVRNKHLFREFCRQQGLPTPGHKLITTPQDIETIAQHLQFPLVIKPIFGAGSDFVVKINNQQELREIYEYVQENLPQAPDSGQMRDLTLMAEEYIDGDEVDIDFILQNGKVKFVSICDNYKTREPFFVETTSAYPSNLPQKDQEALVAMAEETLEKLGIQNGCIHFEAKLTSEGPVPVEVNMRMGGDEVHFSLKETWGVDFVDEAVKVALGIYIPKYPPLEPKKYIMSEILQPDHSGILVTLHVDSDFEELPYLENFYFTKDVGDPVLAPPEGYDNLGWVTVSGENLLDAQDNLKEVLGKISFSVVKFDESSAIGKTKRSSRFRAASLRKNMLLGHAKIENIRQISKADQRQLHIGIAGNRYPSVEGTVEAELSAVGDTIQQTLSSLGYKTTYIDFNNLPAALKILERGQIDLIFNVCERLNNSSLLEPHPTAFFDAFQIPYTGSNPFTLALCMDKIRVKKLLAFHKIPTPKWDYVYRIDDEIEEDLEYPLIVKPAQSDNSIGITNDSVVTTPEELKAQIEYVTQKLNQPALIEEYIEGDEYDVSILGSEVQDLKVLPLSRSVFDKLPQGLWHIYPYDAKYLNDPVYRNSIEVQRPPKNMENKLQSLVSEIALDTYNILDCHDYGRVEVRVDQDGNPYVLELNPNPSINMGDCVPEVAQLAGMNYGEFLEHIISLAITRYKDRPPYYHLQGNLL